MQLRHLYCSLATTLLAATSSYAQPAPGLGSSLKGELAFLEGRSPELRAMTYEAEAAPDVVWFGEMLPPAALEAALQAANTCDVFFSIGTSSLVEPAASLARVALRRGIAVLEINPATTPLTSRATFALRGASGEILPALVKTAWPGA